MKSILTDCVPHLPVRQCWPDSDAGRLRRCFPDHEPAPRDGEPPGRRPRPSRGGAAERLARWAESLLRR
jgi:hypothetical protein